MKKVKFPKKQSDLAKPLTLGLLLDYWDNYLLPKISDMMEESIKINNAKLEHNLKVYIDDKLADYTSDIFKRLDKKYQNDRKFKEKVVVLLKKHHIGTAVDLAYLEGLVA